MDTKPAYGERTRICLVVPSHFGALFGGAEYQAKLLVDHLTATGAYEVFYLARFTNPAFVAGDHSVVKIGGVPGLRRFGYFFDAFSLLTALKRIRPHLIYQRVGCAYTGIAAFYARQTGCQMIWHIASDKDVTPEIEVAPLGKLHKAIEQWFLEYGVRNATHIVAQTKHQAAMLMANYGRQALKVIPNFHPIPRDISLVKSATVQVTWIANFKRMKRPEIFLRLAREFETRTDTEFLMVGESASEQSWQDALNAEMAQLPNVRYLGAMAQDAVNAVLARAHILVNTSDYEGFSNTFIQAWMRRVAVLSYRVNPDGVFDDGRLGVCADGDYRVLVESLARLIEDLSLRASIAERSFVYACKRHSTRNVEQIRFAIDHLVGRSSCAFKDSHG